MSADPYTHLTEDERRYLAMHARYEADRQLDPRNYATGQIHDRWRVIADDLHNDPWGNQS